SFGATKELPRTVVFGLSAERRSDPCALPGLPEAVSDRLWPCPDSSALNARQNSRMSFLMATRFNITFFFKAIEFGRSGRPPMSSEAIGRAVGLLNHDTYQGGIRPDFNAVRKFPRRLRKAASRASPEDKWTYSSGLRPDLLEDHPNWKRFPTEV